MNDRTVKENKEKFGENTFYLNDLNIISCGKSTKDIKSYFKKEKINCIYAFNVGGWTDKNNYKMVGGLKMKFGCKYIADIHNKCERTTLLIINQNHCQKFTVVYKKYGRPNTCVIGIKRQVLLNRSIYIYTY